MKNKIILAIAIILVVLIIVVVLLNNNKVDNSLSNINSSEEQSNNFYVVDGAIYEKTSDVNENAILANTEKINKAYQQYLQNMNVHFTIIPDKTYYLENKIDTDFNDVAENVKNNLDNNIQYFDISNVLELEDYYRTDMHWKQENLENVIDVIEQEMKIKNSNSEEKTKYEEKILGDFYGTYYKEIENNTKSQEDTDVFENTEVTSEDIVKNENNIEPDELKYLTNEQIEKSTVYNAETESNEPVYNISKAEKTGNLYDTFLSGASAIEIIKNEQSETNKKLILFRDSFGSSIAPLLINNYEEIVLVDLRYVNYTILSNYVDFSNYENQDVLFLYSSKVINKSGIFR